MLEQVSVPNIYNKWQGPFDAALFNAVFGNVFDQREALLRACLLLKPGAPPPLVQCACTHYRPMCLISLIVLTAGPTCSWLC